MTNPTDAQAVTQSSQPPEPTTARLPRIWPAAVVLAIFWAAYGVLRWTDLGAALGFFEGFLMLTGCGLLTTLSFIVWWLAASRTGRAERFAVLGTCVIALVATAVLADKSLGTFYLLIPGLPVVLTAWTVALFIVRKRVPQRRRLTLMGVVCLCWSFFLLLRGEGIAGDGAQALRWRWSPSAESEYLAHSSPMPDTAQPSDTQEPLRAEPGDWPAFRGPNRDGDLLDARIDTDWQAHPPKLVWKRRIGPAWSSIIVVGDRLFTQEQRGEEEAVVCLEAATGLTLWSHEDRARHDDHEGGAGPRATPTFDGGRIFALGATGILNCLDAETGRRLWSRDLAADAATKVAMWGFSSSPLVVGDLVVVFACGDFADQEDKDLLLAYHCDSGKPAWSASAGKISYSSPQLALVDGSPQLLMVSDNGLFAHEPSSGKRLWHHEIPPGSPGVPRSVQPQAIGSDGVVFDAGSGTMRLDVSQKDGAWAAAERWVSRQLKPAFNDFVISGKAIYGFDARVLTCVDAETGKRRWRAGRYGSGQVLLLGDQPLLMVVTEEGEVVLVAASPDEHQELARLQAIEGKTWNHPTIAHGRLYVRNAQEMVCYELTPEIGR